MRFLALFLPILAPIMAWWVRREEAIILKMGRPLNEEEMELARKAGVAIPDQIRVLAVEPVPTPGPAWIACAAHRIGIPAMRPIGMTLRYGIYLHKKYAHRPSLLFHECVHTGQYEKLGIKSFLSSYVKQCLTDGYHQAPLEREAVERTRQVFEK